jgi:hypothetical protein
MIHVDRPPTTSEAKLPPSYESENLPLLPNLPYRLTADDIGDRATESGFRCNPSFSGHCGGWLWFDKRSSLALRDVSAAVIR